MYLLHVLYRSGHGHTLRFETALSRALVVIALSAQSGILLTLAEAA